MHPLVDAFIKGRAKTKRTTGQYFEKKGRGYRSCAVGAIYYGLFEKVPESPNLVVVPAIYGQNEDIRKFVNVPCEHDDTGTVVAILTHLNDEHEKEWKDADIQKWLTEVLDDRASSLPPV